VHGAVIDQSIKRCTTSEEGEKIKAKIAGLNKAKQDEIECRGALINVLFASWELWIIIKRSFSN